MLCFSDTCPCSISLTHVHAVFLWHKSMQYISDTCPCSISVYCPSVLRQRPKKKKKSPFSGPRVGKHVIGKLFCTWSVLWLRRCMRKSDSSTWIGQLPVPSRHSVFCWLLHITSFHLLSTAAAYITPSSADCCRSRHSIFRWQLQMMSFHLLLTVAD